MQAGKYRFYGTACLIGDTEFNRLGQYGEFDAPLAEAVMERSAFLPEQDFNNIFTASECAMYPDANGYPEAPQSLKDKRTRATQVRESLLNGASPIEAGQ